jgi:polyisoprenyl-phosphate glycosyltransferase
MKKIIILIPIFNDWESLIKLLNEINSSIQNIHNYEFNCIVINDCSTVKQPNISKPINIKSLSIINMKNNRGHARCNAFGIRYINSNEICDYVILMDGDGEDRPQEIRDLINEISINPETSVVAKRIKRSEGPIFQLMYQIHKLITYLFTGKKVNFGNYSCLTKQDIKVLSDKASLWSSYSGSVKRNINKLNEINSTRGTRYFGPSKMSLFNLGIHSFSIIAVFKYQVFLRSSFLIIALSFLNNLFGIYTILFQVLLVAFNLIIFIVSLRENEKALIESQENLLNKIDIAH